MRQGDRPRRAVHRVEEGNPQLVMEVRARRAPRLLAGPAQKIGEDVVALGEVGVAAGAFVRVAGRACIFAVISALGRRFLGPRGVDLAGVVAAALFRVRQEVVGDRNLFKPLLRMLVARVEIRVQLLGELPVGLADLLRAGGLGDAEDIIGVFQTRLRERIDCAQCLPDSPPPSPDLLGAS